MSTLHSLLHPSSRTRAVSRSVRARALGTTQPEPAASPLAPSKTPAFSVLGLAVRQEAETKALDGDRLEASNRSESRSELPASLKRGAERLSGESLDDVVVHYDSSSPALVQAYAYARGAHIHIASGQQRRLPHETWHVVQQKQARVRAERASPLGPLNAHEGLEREAERMGLLAVAEGYRPSAGQAVRRDALGGKVIQSIPDVLQCASISELKTGLQEQSAERATNQHYMSIITQLDALATAWDEAIHVQDVQALGAAITSIRGLAQQAASTHRDQQKRLKRNRALDELTRSLTEKAADLDAVMASLQTYTAASENLRPETFQDTMDDLADLVNLSRLHSLVALRSWARRERSSLKERDSSRLVLEKVLNTPELNGDEGPVRRGNRRGSIRETKGLSARRLDYLRDELTLTLNKVATKISHRPRHQNSSFQNIEIGVQAEAARFLKAANCGEFAFIIYASMRSLNVNAEYIAMASMAGTYVDESGKTKKYDHAFNIHSGEPVPLGVGVQVSDDAIVIDAWDNYSLKTLADFKNKENPYGNLLTSANIKINNVRPVNQDEILSENDKSLVRKSIQPFVGAIKTPSAQEAKQYAHRGGVFTFARQHHDVSDDR